MKVAEKITNAISNEAMDVKMPGEEITKSLNRGNEIALSKISIRKTENNVAL